MDTGPEFVVEEWQQGLSLIDFLRIFVTRKRVVIGTMIGCGALSVIIALLLPNTYTATAVILPPQKEQSSASMLVGQLGPLAAAAGADFGLKNSGDLYIGLLGSRAVTDTLIRRFGLQELYRAKSLTGTRSKLKSNSRFTNGTDSLIRISVQDTDPRRAAALANAYVSELSAQNRRLAITEASQRRIFLERQLAEQKAALAAAEEEMKRTQQKTGVMDVSGQTQAAIASLAQISAQITAGEVSLERLRMGATPENPVVLQSQMELTALRSQMRKLEHASGTGSGALVPAGAIPSAGLAYIRNLRDLKYHEFLFEMLSKQYEAARIDEIKAAPEIQIVDAAAPPDENSGPARSLIIFLGLALGTLIGGACAYVQYDRASSIRKAAPETVRALRQNASGDTA